jgi:hypothetical protein
MSYGQDYNIFNDLHDLERMVGSLKDYLKSNDIYGSIGGGIFTGGGAPNLTIGTIIMRLRRLEALRDMLDARRQESLDRTLAQFETIRDDMWDRYTLKMEREAHSRLDAMTRFFEECRDDPQNCPRIYGPEAFRRTVVEELVTTMTAADIHSQELDSKVSRMDKQLRRYLIPSEFQWDDLLKPIYPQNNYWWLWMAPQNRG